MPLAPTVRTKLATAGFRTAADLEGIGPADLARGSSAPARYNQNTWFTMLHPTAWLQYQLDPLLRNFQYNQ